MTDLTNRERSAYVFILEYIDRHGYAPNIREVMEGVGYKAPSAASACVRRLVAKGLINKTPHVSRGISLKGAK